MQEFFEHIKVYTKTAEGALYRIHCIKSLSDGRFAALNCDPINRKNPTQYFLDHEAYFLDQLIYSELTKDLTLYDSLQEAVNSFDWVIGTDSKNTP